MAGGSGYGSAPPMPGGGETPGAVGSGMGSGMGLTSPGMGSAGMAPPGMAGGGKGAMAPGMSSSGQPGQVGPGAGPVFAEKEQKEVRMIDRTDFVVQFIWTRTLERDRKAEDPRKATAEGGAPADATAAPAPGGA